MGQQYGPRLRFPPGLRSQSKPVKVTIPYSVKPKDRTAGTNSPLAFQCCPCPVSRHRVKQLSFSLPVACVLGSALGSIVARHAYWSGNQVPEATFITFHSHLNHPRTTDNIEPPITLTMAVIMISPLIWGYKYGELEKEKGWLRGFQRNRE